MPITQEDLAKTFWGGMLRDMWGAAKLPGDVYAGRVDPLSNEGIERANALAGLAMGGGIGRAAMAPADEVSLGTFGGVRASSNFKAAQQEALAEARERGKSVGQPTASNPHGEPGWEERLTAIYRDTGWFPGPDGKWRFEIPDAGAEVAGATEFSGRLGDYVSHPRLYEEYPDLAGAQLTVHPRALDNLLGRATRGDDGQVGKIELMAAEGKSPEEIRSVLLHEMQHLIQHKEGFTPGGSPDAVGFPTYWNMPGEIEARDVQKRAAYTQPMRTALEPEMLLKAQERARSVARAKAQRLAAAETGVAAKAEREAEAERQKLVDSFLIGLGDGKGPWGGY
jgi:hypothetical protein